MGVPLHLEVVEGPSLYIEALLFPEVKKARDIRDLMRSMREVEQKGGPVRRMAFSIEGTKVVMDGNVIERCVVDQMALTVTPVNPFTWAELVKSLKKGMLGTSIAGMGALTGGEGNVGLNTSTDAQILNQSLDAGIGDLIWGPCNKNHYDPKTGRFRLGVRGALQHMVECRGYAPGPAAEILKRLYHGIFA